MKKLLFVLLTLLLSACGEKIDGTYTSNMTGVAENGMSYTFKADGTATMSIGSSTFPMEMPYEVSGNKVKVTGQNGDATFTILENGDLLMNGMRFKKGNALKPTEVLSTNESKPTPNAPILNFMEPSEIKLPLKTRFGEISISEEKILLFNGQPLSPSIQGNNNLSLADHNEGGQSDVLLVQDIGGTACPAQYYFVSITPSGAKPSKAFGSCSDLFKTAKNGAEILVSMPGPSENENHVFTFSGGEVLDNGKPIQ